MITRARWDALSDDERASLKQLMPGIEKAVEIAEKQAKADRRRLQLEKEGLVKLSSFVLERYIVMKCKCKLCGSYTIEVWRMKKISARGGLVGELENFYRVTEEEANNLHALPWFAEIAAVHDRDFKGKEHAPKLVELRSTRTCRFCETTLAAQPKASLVRAAISMSYRIVEPKKEIPRSEVMMQDRDLDLGMEDM